MWQGFKIEMNGNESGSDHQVDQFCKWNGVSFPFLFSKPFRLLPTGNGSYFRPTVWPVRCLCI